MSLSRLLICVAAVFAPLTWAQSEHWVATWGASPQAPRSLPGASGRGGNGGAVSGNAQNQLPPIQP